MFVGRNSLSKNFAASKLSKPMMDSRIHTTTPTRHAAAAALKLPSNVDANEMIKFSPQRSRDINSSSMLVHSFNSNKIGNINNRIDVTLDHTNSYSKADARLASYDCINTVALNSTMQSNVPQPFGGLHNYAIAISMPGGGWSSLDKYTAGQIQDSHYTALKKEFRKNWYEK